MKDRLIIKWNSEIAVSVLFFVPQINYYIANLLNMRGLPTVTRFVYAALCLLGIFSYIITLRGKVAFISFGALVTLLILSLIINENTQRFMFNSTLASSSLPMLMLIYLPMFLLMTGKIDFDKLMICFKNFSTLTIVVALVSFFDYLLIKIAPPPDYMSFAYMMLNPTVFCFMWGWKKNNRIAFFLSIVALFINLIVGCRGAVVTITLFMFLYVMVFFIKEKSDLKGFAIKILILFLIVVITINADSILNIVADYLKGMGFTSRTVSKLSLGAGDFVQSESRMDIWKQAISNIGILGKGLFGDRTFLIDENSNSTYAHNLFLELFIDLGFILGLLAVSLILFLVFKALAISVKSKNQMLTKMAFVMVSVLFVKHMVSVSFLTSFDFWFYLGLCVNIVLSHRSGAEKESVNCEDEI